MNLIPMNPEPNYEAVKGQMINVLYNQRSSDEKAMLAEFRKAMPEVTEEQIAYIMRDPEFFQHYGERMKAKELAREEELWDALHRRATSDEDKTGVKAAELLLRLTGRIQPHQNTVTIDNRKQTVNYNYAQMSEEELDAIIHNRKYLPSQTGEDTQSS